jgi:hypothetical protein
MFFKFDNSWRAVFQNSGSLVFSSIFNSSKFANSDARPAKILIAMIMVTQSAKSLSTNSQEQKPSYWQFFQVFITHFWQLGPQWLASVAQIHVVPGYGPNNVSPNILLQSQTLLNFFWSPLFILKHVLVNSLKTCINVVCIANTLYYKFGDFHHTFHHHKFQAGDLQSKSCCGIPKFLTDAFKNPRLIAFWYVFKEKEKS